MAILECSTQIIYTIVLFAFAGMALTIYFALFYMAMITLDGCLVCQKLRAMAHQLLTDIRCRAQNEL